MHKRGDTLIEVMFAVAVFGLAAVGTIALMNRGLASVQTSIETTMARQEIDAQAEALRFIHDAYLTEPATKITDATGNEISTNNYRNLWKAIVAQAYPASTVDASGAYSGGVVSEDPNFFTRVVENKATCDSLFTTATSNGAFAVPSRSFVLNPRGLNKLTEVDPTTDQTKILSSYDIRRYILATATDAPNPFTTAATYPRLLYGDTTDADNLSDIYIDNNVLKTKNFGSTLSSAEGIWVTAITSKSGLQCYDAEGNAENNVRPDFYDFHIQTCWDSISGDATVISSTVRLFNPDQVNLKKASMITFDNVTWEAYSNTQNTSPNCYGSDPPEHVIANGTDIEFVGYTGNAMDEGVRYSIADITNFTLNVDVDTNGILTHPGGDGLTITVGPIKASLRDNGGSITSGSETQTINSKTFHLSMSRTGNSYEACVNDACVSATSTTADPTVDFNFKHNSHCCDAISRAKLSNIEMYGNTAEELASDTCVPTTVITDPEPNPIPTPKNPDPTPSPDEPDPSPTPDPEPEPTEQVEATIVATETNPLQNFDIKFTKSDSTRMGIRSMKIPFVSQVASGISVDSGTCGSAGSGLLGSLLHCGFPYASSYTNFQFQYADGQFIIYLDRDSFTDDTSTTYFGTGSTISDFWSRSGLTVTVYFYDQIYYYNITEGHESDYAAYSISSDNTNVVDSNGRYWILARVYGNAGTRNYWADKMEIINQRTNTAPSAYLK